VVQSFTSIKPNKTTLRLNVLLYDILCRYLTVNYLFKCPCVIKPGTNQCIAYDSRFQASSIEEAILAFPDISGDTRTLEAAAGGNLNADAFSCRTLECQTCVALLVPRLVSAGLLKAPSEITIPVARNVTPKNCHRFRFANPPPHRFLGQRFTIACINRGEAESEETDLLNLCSVCWTWRQLPEDYFPRLVNELLCVNGNGSTCLSGWGSCHQRFRNVDVLKRVGGKWQTTTISIANCCDCKVKAGTEAHALVVGKAYF
uniref:F-box domain-containing protein n=1 Tax=Syphacia muris TaxID=451379 RepID=A0A0N5AR30_9BILA